jgi:hypothetical protein
MSTLAGTHDPQLQQSPRRRATTIPLDPTARANNLEVSGMVPCQPMLPTFAASCYLGRSTEILDLEQVCWHRSCKYFWGKYVHLVKKWQISTLDKVIYFKGTIFQQSTKPLFTSQNRVEISWKKFSLFFKHASSSIDPKFSMGRSNSRKYKNV